MTILWKKESSEIRFHISIMVKNMRTFLIDLENVKNQGLVGIEFLSAEDRVFIFYSESANSLSIPTVQAMNRSKAEVEYVYLQRSGRNAMDFQIVALLGFLIGSEKAGKFCIVSQDNGYLSPVEFFMDHAAGALDVHVLIAPSIQKAVRKWNNMDAHQQAKVEIAETEVVEETPVAAEEEELIIEVENEMESETEEVVAEEEVEVVNAVETHSESLPEEVAAAEEVEELEEENKQNKRRGRPRKENGGKNKKAKVNQVDVPQEVMDRIHGVLGGHGDENQTKYEKVIGQALLTTNTKNEFYQYFRKVLGIQNGGNLYHAIRSDYDKLKAAVSAEA